MLQSYRQKIDLDVVAQLSRKFFLNPIYFASLSHTHTHTYIYKIPLNFLVSLWLNLSRFNLCRKQTPELTSDNYCNCSSYCDHFVAYIFCLLDHIWKEKNKVQLSASRKWYGLKISLFCYFFSSFFPSCSISCNGYWILVTNNRVFLCLKILVKLCNILSLQTYFRGFTLPLGVRFFCSWNL